jgi:hypothetical protein
LWEQTAAASSLQAMARGYLARKKFMKVSIPRCILNVFFFGGGDS